MYTVFSAFQAMAHSRPDAHFLCVPPRAKRSYAPAGVVHTYGDALERVLELKAMFHEAGYGPGHRVILALDNRPDMVFHWFALNSLGCSIVPINPSWKASELSYILGHVEPALVIALPDRRDLLSQAQAVAGSSVPMASDRESAYPAPLRAADRAIIPGFDTEAAVLYTSGTTARPKGCVLSNHYFVAAGHWYASRGGKAAYHFGRDRLYSPLPLFHMAGLSLTTMGMMLTGGCLILPERFSARNFWTDVVLTDATAVHYLGVILAALMARPPEPGESSHRLRFAMGVGADAALRERAQMRYGIPFVEGWGMTETGRSCFSTDSHGRRDLNGIGRSEPGLELSVQDEAGECVAPGVPGELCARHSASNPRSGFFSAYLKDEAAVEHAWRGGWLHTGDVAMEMPDGMLVFVDRQKNIIRRSGENVAAAEVESVLTQHPDVVQVAVGGVKDGMREEEVGACIVLKPGAKPTPATARKIFKWCLPRMAYYKLPAWITFMEQLPLTATNKIFKNELFGPDRNEALWAGVVDLRESKSEASKG